MYYPFECHPNRFRITYGDQLDGLTAPSSIGEFYDQFPMDMPDEATKRLYNQETGAYGVLVHVQHDDQSFIILLHDLEKIDGKIFGVEGDLKDYNYLVYRSMENLPRYLAMNSNLVVPKHVDIEACLVASQNVAYPLQPVNWDEGDVVNVPSVLPVPHFIAKMFVGGWTSPLECYNILKAYGEKYNVMEAMELPLAWARATLPLQESTNGLQASMDDPPRRPAMLMEGIKLLLAWAWAWAWATLTLQACMNGSPRKQVKIMEARLLAWARAALTLQASTNGPPGSPLEASTNGPPRRPATLINLEECFPEASHEEKTAHRIGHYRWGSWRTVMKEPPKQTPKQTGLKPLMGWHYGMRSSSSRQHF